MIRSVICVLYNHLWYLTPQLIILALFDKDLEMAKMLYSIDRVKIQTGKPTFPIISPA